jgi:hypothetical protein
MGALSGKISPMIRGVNINKIKMARIVRIVLKMLFFMMDACY